MTLTEKVSYIKGLFDGLDINADKKEGKVLIAMLDLLDDISLTVSDLEDELGAIGSEVDEIYEELEVIEDDLYGDDDEDFDDEDEGFNTIAKRIAFFNNSPQVLVSVFVCCLTGSMIGIIFLFDGFSFEKSRRANNSNCLPLIYGKYIRCYF